MSENKQKIVKMVLEYLSMHFCRIGIFDYKPTRAGRQISYLLNSVFLFIFGSNLLTMIYELVYYSKTFSERAEGLLFATCACLVFSWYSVSIHQRESYPLLFSELNAVLKRRIQNPESKEIYDKTNNIIETATKWLMPISIGYATFYVVCAVLTSFYKYFSSDGDRDSFRKAFPATYPIDWKTPTGFLAVAVYQDIFGFLAVYLTSQMISLSVACCCYIMNFVSDLEQALRELNKIMTNLENRKPVAGESNQIVQTLTEILGFHMDARQFAIRFSETGRPVIFIYFLFSLVCFCNVLLGINKALESGNIMIMVQLISLALVIGCTLYLFCYFGDYATQRLEDIGDEAYQLDWYYLPTVRQMDLILFIASSQRRIYIEGLAGARCTREVFMKIMNKTLSFFMVLREL